MHSRDRHLATQLHDLQFAYYRVSLDLLIKPKKAVGDSEHRIVDQPHFAVLSDEESCRFPTGEKESKLLHKALHLNFTIAMVLPSQHSAERVYNDNASIGSLHLFRNLFQHSLQPAFDQFLA